MSLTVFGQAADEHEVGVSELLARVPGDGALGEGHGLAQLVPRGGPEQTRPAGSLRDVRVSGRAEPFEQGSPGAAVFVLLAEKETQLGVPIPLVVLERIGLEGRLPGDPRLV